ncbi:variant erythrocyte surface antigen-1, beta subunit, partial [Babesia divergens]
MYYTDVFVGQDNNDKLKKALEAELNGSGLTDELTDLAEGLKDFIGYGSNGELTGKGIGKKDYASSYSKSEATWPECGSKPCPSCSSCHSSGPSSPSCHGSCCENCDVRKAAKIFLGMLPCLYYGLKILWVRCNDASQWKDWQGKISQDNSLRRFLVGMGYNLGKLDENKKGGEISSFLTNLFNNSNPLEKLYEKSKKYFTSLSSPSHVPSSDSKPKPKTVRDILLWLSGLPFTSGFKALLDHCKGLCDSVNSVQFNDFETSLFNSCFLLPVSVLTVIQRPGTSEVFPSESFINSKFFYPEDPFDLFNMLFDYVRKVFPPLKFLCLQCERKAAEGGWASCTFGQRCAEALQKSLPSGFTSSGCGSCDGHETYLCTANSTPDVHDGHCLNGQCLGSDSGKCKGKTGAHSSTNCKNPCSHPLLRFLLDGSEDLQNLPTPFKLPEGFPKMGFKISQLPTNGWSGYHSLLGVLDIFVGKANTNEKVCFLRDLLRLLLCLTRTPPS